MNLNFFKITPTTRISTGDVKLFLFLLLSCFFLLTACADKQEQEKKYLQRAESAFAKGNYDKTRVELKNVLQINPKNTDARYLQAQLAEKNQEWRKMYSLLTSIVDEKPDFLAAQIKLGMLFLLSGELEKTTEKADLVLAKEEENTQALILQALVFARQEKFSNAEEITKKVLSLDPGNVEATFVLARLYAKDKKYSQSLALIDDAITKHPDQFSLAMFKIQMLSDSGNTVETERAFEALIERYPDKALAYYNFVKLYMSQGELNKAEQVIRRYIAQKPDESEPKLVLVKFFINNDDKGKAEDLLLGFIEEEPENFRYQFALADLYKDQPQRAINVLEKIIEQDQTGPSGLLAQNQIAYYVLKQGDRDRARQLIEDVIDNDNRNTNALMMRSRMLIDEGRYDDAIADLRIILRNQPESEKAIMLSASAYMKGGNIELAQDSLEKALTINPQNIDVRKDLARILVKGKDEEGAISLLERANQSHNQNPQVQAMLVDLYLRKEEWDKAEESARLISAEGDDSGLSNFKLAQIYIAQKKYQLAADEYIKILQIKPLDIKVLTGLSKIYLAMGEAGKAESMLDDLIVKNQQNASLVNLRGSLFKSQKQLKEAEKYFTKAIAMDPQLSLSYRNLASVYIVQNNLDKAISVYKMGLEAIPQDSNLMFGLAMLKEKSGDTKAAIDIYSEMLKVAPDNKIAANNLAALLANTTDDPQRLKYALELVQEFKDYKIPVLLDTYAWLNFLNGQFDEALKASETVIELDANIPETYYHLGMVYAEKGRTEEAKIALEKAVAEGNEFPGIEKARDKLQQLETL